MSLREILRSPDDATVGRFLETWHGPPARRPAPTPDLSGLPKPLARFVEVTSGWPDLFVQNRLVVPDRLELDDGKLVFYVENQAVYLWATDPSGDDPPVWGRFNEDNGRWQAEREPLSRFLLEVALFETVIGAEHGGAAIFLTLKQLDTVLDGLDRVSLGSWRWPYEPAWFYAGDEMLAFVNPNGLRRSGPADAFDVLIAARSAPPLAPLAARTDIEWERRPEVSIPRLS